MYQGVQSRRNAIPKGSISVRAYPVSEYQDAYRAASHDLNGSQLFITTKHNERLKEFLRKADIISGVQGTQVCAPCIVGNLNNVEMQYYNALLLVPPDIDEGSDLFVRGQAVPQLKVSGYAGSKDNPTGIYFASGHTGRQKYFVHPFEELVHLMASLKSIEEVEFQGVINHIPGDGNYPCIHLLKNYDSEQNTFVLRSSVHEPEVFAQNREMLQELRVQMQRGRRFWWDVELISEPAKELTGRLGLEL